MSMHRCDRPDIYSVFIVNKTFLCGTSFAPYLRNHCANEVEYEYTGETSVYAGWGQFI